MPQLEKLYRWWLWQAASKVAPKSLLLLMFMQLHSTFSLRLGWTKWYTLSHRVWQRWWDVSSEIMLQKDSWLHLELSLTLSISLGQASSCCENPVQGNVWPLMWGFSDLQPMGNKILSMTTWMSFLWQHMLELSMVAWFCWYAECKSYGVRELPPRFQRKVWKVRQRASDKAVNEV